MILHISDDKYDAIVCLFECLLYPFHTLKGLMEYYVLILKDFIPAGCYIVQFT